MYIHTTSRALQEERYLRRVTERRPATGPRTEVGFQRRLSSLRTVAAYPPLVGRIRGAS
jgi:hypothetical protein